MSDAESAAALSAYHAEHVVGCTRCPLSEERTQVVVGNGDPDADIMFVGEAPGYHEDRQGLPFVGAAGKLLDELLAGISLTRDDVFVANVLKCRPPGNRDPQPAEIRACEEHLFAQLGFIRPRVVCTLGNFATKLLSGRPEGITRVHGHELPVQIGGRAVLLYPLFHPAAVLRAHSLRETIEADFARIPALVDRDAGAPAPQVPEAPETVEASADDAPDDASPESQEQLGLF